VLNSSGRVQMDTVVLIVLIASVIDATLLFVQLMRRS